MIIRQNIILIGMIYLSSATQREADCSPREIFFAGLQPSNKVFAEVQAYESLMLTADNDCR
jgi:hypothetical protein